MKIVIVGAGEVGGYLCGLLSDQAHDVTVIESAVSAAERIDEQFDARVLLGNGSSAETLTKASVGDCDFFVAMTSDDKTNLVSSSVAKALGAKAIICRIHDQTYTDNSLVNYQVHFGIDYMLNPESLSALAMAKSIRSPGRVAVENFARGQIEVQQVRVASRSKLVGRRLQDLRLNSEVKIGYVQRDSQLEVANAETVIESGNLVTLFGSSDSLFKITSKLDPKNARETVRVVLSGGSETAIALVRMLSNPRFKVRVLEGDSAICSHLAEKFPNITVINGDATSLRLLEEEQIGSTDYFVACTKRDEDNIVTGLQASKLGAPHVYLVINKPDYEEVVQALKGNLGIEMMVSPRVATANEVLRYLSSESLIDLATLPNSLGKILEIRVSHNSRYAGRRLREIPFPEGSVAVALQHKFQAKVPGAEDPVLAGDRLVVITREGNVDDLRELLTDE